MNKLQSISIAGPSYKHVSALDGVRGMAILLVLCDHLLLFNNNSGSRLVDSLAAVRSLGWMGVDLFFVLSGFLITGILYDTVHDPHFFRNFYMRRFLRIFPLYYGFLFALILLTPVLQVAWGWRALLLLAYQQNASIWFPLMDFHLSPLMNLSHFWSLAVEEQFYLFWPFLVFFVKDRRKLIFTALALSVAALLLRTLVHFVPVTNYVSVVHEWTLCRMDTLMIGGCLALLLRGHNPWLTWKLGLIAFAVSMATMCSIAVADPRRDVNQVFPAPPVTWDSYFFVGTFGYTLLAIGFAGLLLVAMDRNTPIHRVFQMTWLRSLGKYSYGIYVLHLLIGYLFGRWMFRLLGGDLRTVLSADMHSRAAGTFIAFFAYVAAIYAAAWLSYNLYEVHFLKLKRYFAYERRVKS